VLQLDLDRARSRLALCERRISATKAKIEDGNFFGSLLMIEQQRLARLEIVREKFDAELKGIEEMEKRIQPERSAPIDESSDLPWIVQKRLTVGGVIFNRGAEMPRDLLYALPNYQTLVDGGFVKQLPVIDSVVKPVPVSAARDSLFAKAIKVVIVPPCGDLLKQRNLSVHETAKLNGCSIARAAEAIMYAKEAGTLWAQAQRIESENFAREHRLHSRRPFVQPDFSTGV
jgi:hypothetical protein